MAEIQDMTIRRERERDIASVHAVEVTAFHQPNEANLVDLLRQNGKLIISLVAEEAGHIISHVAFSEITTEPESKACRILGLGPVAVLPERQRQGVGAELMRSRLKMAQARGYTHVVLLGDPAYYRRFGFAPAKQYGIRNKDTDGDEFMIKAIAGSTMPAGALMKYQPESALV